MAQLVEVIRPVDLDRVAECAAVAVEGRVELGEGTGQDVVVVLEFLRSLLVLLVESVPITSVLDVDLFT